MKSYLTLFFLLCTFVIYSQQNHAPIIITKASKNKTIHTDIYSVELIEVLEDSRCPKNVNCFWEGEAKVKVRIYTNQKFTKDVVLSFGAKSIRPEQPKLIIGNKEHEIIAHNLSPYPENHSTIAASDYQLELIVK